MMVVVIAAIVLVERGHRRITVQYAKTGRRPAPVRRRQHAHSIEGEHRRRHSGDLCVVDPGVPGDDRADAPDRLDRMLDGRWPRSAPLRMPLYNLLSPVVRILFFAYYLTHRRLIFNPDDVAEKHAQGSGSHPSSIRPRDAHRPPEHIATSPGRASPSVARGPSSPSIGAAARAASSAGLPRGPRFPFHRRDASTCDAAGSWVHAGPRRPQFSLSAAPPRSSIGRRRGHRTRLRSRRVNSTAHKLCATMTVHEEGAEPGPRVSVRAVDAGRPGAGKGTQRRPFRAGAGSAFRPGGGWWGGAFPPPLWRRAGRRGRC
jgi:hypothetical protein